MCSEATCDNYNPHYYPFSTVRLERKQKLVYTARKKHYISCVPLNFFENLGCIDEYGCSENCWLAIATVSIVYFLRYYDSKGKCNYRDMWERNFSISNQFEARNEREIRKARAVQLSQAHFSNVQLSGNHLSRSRAAFVVRRRVATAGTNHFILTGFPF